MLLAALDTAAVQPRSLARQAACKARQGRESPAYGGLEEISSQVGRRLKEATQGWPKLADRPSEIVL